MLNSGKGLVHATGDAGACSLIYTDIADFSCPGVRLEEPPRRDPCLSVQTGTYTRKRNDSSEEQAKKGSALTWSDNTDPGRMS